MELLDIIAILFGSTGILSVAVQSFFTVKNKKIDANIEKDKVLINRIMNESDQWQEQYKCIKDMLIRSREQNKELHQQIQTLEIENIRLRRINND
jgi:BMFP domain-containing protein YqiC